MLPKENQKVRVVGQRGRVKNNAVVHKIHTNEQVPN